MIYKLGHRRSAFRSIVVALMLVSTHVAIPKTIASEPEVLADFFLISSDSTREVVGQEVDIKSTEKQKSLPHTKEELSLANVKVEVKPVARDEEIRQRLESVLKATQWFTDSKVRVEHGVVFLSGETETDDLRKWASDLAGNTQDVVAVANRMKVTSPSIWDFSSTWSGMSKLWRDFIRSLPFFVFGLLILASSVGAGYLAIRSMDRILAKKIRATRCSRSH